MEVSLEPRQKLQSPAFVWSECLKLIKPNVSPMTFNTWFTPIKPLEINEATIKIQLPNAYFWEWIDQRYNALLNNSIKEILGKDAAIEYIIMDDWKEEPSVIELHHRAPLNVPTPKVETKPAEHKVDYETNLNQKYTFDNFIKGSGNELAVAAGMAIGNNPGGTSFNPFFVYGGVGLGKTHLVQAIGNLIFTNDQTKRVIYLSADRFSQLFVDAIQSNSAAEFQRFYRSMDVLILDDIQFLIGREKTQDLFFHTFNSLHQSGKQIILTSDKPPKDLKGMDSRLISRFHWGLTADVQPPDYETRLAILNKKAEEFGLNVTPDIYEYIATHVTSNIRELEGCLLRLLANVSLSAREIDLELAKKSVQEISTSRKITISVDLITKIVCEEMSIDENKVRDKTRKQEIVIARQLAMYFAKELTRISLKNVGLYFGGRDHSTVIHACTSIQNLIDTDANFAEIAKSIKNKIELACS
jgi:chromosomal replication initiator protein